MAEQRKDGGPAFPHAPFHNPPYPERGDVLGARGMTLRDYFAAAAMQAELITNGVPGPACDALIAAARKANRDPVDQIAVCAYEMADAMLKARES